MKILKILKNLVSKNKTHFEPDKNNLSKIEYSNNEINIEHHPTSQLDVIVRSDFETAKKIIDKIPDLNAPIEEFNYHRPLLHCLVANYQCKPEIIRYILQSGANPNIIDEKGKSALHWVHNLKPEFLELLLELGGNINHVNNSGNNLLFNFVNSYENFEWCIEHQIDVNYRKKNGINILYELVHFSFHTRARILSKLISKGIVFDYYPSEDNSDPNFFTGYTPLQYYVYYRKSDLVKVLLEHGADIHKKTKRVGFVYINMKDEFEEIPTGITALEVFNKCKPFYKVGWHPEIYTDIDRQVAELENYLTGRLE